MKGSTGTAYGMDTAPTITRTGGPVISGNGKTGKRKDPASPSGGKPAGSMLGIGWPESRRGQGRSLAGTERCIALARRKKAFIRALTFDGCRRMAACWSESFPVTRYPASGPFSARQAARFIPDNSATACVTAAAYRSTARVALSFRGMEGRQAVQRHVGIVTVRSNLF